MPVGLILFFVFLFVFLTLFLLSVFGPTDRETGFWGVIRKVRSGMDFCSYWFFNLCGIGVGVFLVVMIVRAALK